MLTKIDSLFYKLPSQITNEAIAFDLDWTLSYSQRHLFPHEPDDIYVLPGRKNKLKHLQQKGYTLLIFTNQYSRSETEKEKKIARVETFLNKIQIDFGIFIATGKDEYRKPNPAMWQMCRRLMPFVRIRYFVGDLPSDELFAQNGKVAYMEVYRVFPTKIPLLTTGNQLVIFIGAPATGKSTFYYKHLSPLGYVHVSQDELKTLAKVKKIVRINMELGKDICLDRTNSQSKQRQFFLQLAEEKGYFVRFFYFVRNGYNENKKRNHPVPDIVYHIFYKNLEIPSNVVKIA